MSNIRIIPSSSINLHAKLDQFITVLRAHDYLVDDPFQPGLSRAEITDLTRNLPCLTIFDQSDPLSIFFRVWQCLRIHLRLGSLLGLCLGVNHRVD
jgi:hypothetical protein